MYGKYIYSTITEWIATFSQPHGYELLSDINVNENSTTCSNNNNNNNNNISTERSYTGLSESWKCNQCNRFNPIDSQVCQDCQIHQEVQKILEELIYKIYENNIGLCEVNMNLTHSPNTTTINRMAAYKTETNTEEESMSLDLNDWACIEKEDID
jgi:hypothetical protein